MAADVEDVLAKILLRMTYLEGLVTKVDHLENLVDDLVVAHGRPGVQCSLCGVDFEDRHEPCSPTALHRHHAWEVGQ